MGLNPEVFWTKEHGHETLYERQLRERQRAEHLARRAEREGTGTVRPGGWEAAVSDQMDGDVSSTRELQERTRGSSRVTGKPHEEWLVRATANVPEEVVRKPDPPRPDPHREAYEAYARKEAEERRAEEQRALSGWLGHIKRKFEADDADARERLDRLG